MQTVPDKSPNGYRVGDITIDLARRQVRRNGKELELGKLSFELFVSLAESAPQVVTQEELAERVWDGRFVNPPTIKQRITLLRQALGDDANQPRYIKVVRGHGYTVVPDVTPIHEDVAKRLKRPALMFAAALSIGLVVVAVLTSIAPPPTTGPVKLAVLPFENLSSDPEDAFFATGLHQEILDRLTQIPDLQVISRNSVRQFAGSPTALEDVAREFNVDAVMEGSVKYDSGRVRISTRLVDPNAGTQLWSNTFERDFSDIFAIQREIAGSVSGVLGIKLGVGGSSPAAGTSSTEAYEAYLAGIDMMRRPNGQDRASFFFTRATEIDPGYAAAWAQLGFATVIRSYWAQPEQAREILNEALQALLQANDLDPKSARVAATLGFVHYSLFDWDIAETYFARAIELNPNRFSLNQHANMLVRAGRITAAKSEYDAAEAVQGPDSSPGQLRRHVSIVQQNYAEARELVALDNVEPRRKGLLLNIALNEGNVDVIKNALAEFSAVHGVSRALDVRVLQAFDSKERALDEIRAVYKDSNLHWSGKNFGVAILAAYFGDPELALEAIAQDLSLTAVRIWVLWYPFMSEVRQLPEFKQLVTDLNLVDYWRTYGWPDTCAPLGEGDFSCW